MRTVHLHDRAFLPWIMDSADDDWGVAYCSVCGENAVGRYFSNRFMSAQAWLLPRKGNARDAELILENKKKLILENKNLLGLGFPEEVTHPYEYERFTLAFCDECTGDVDVVNSPLVLVDQWGATFDVDSFNREND